ncbi:MAG TPA: sugar phosphate isomerase/epimerase [Cyclobacteriaceae bacterium]|jgi:sugar phosphate isomerase/epimerase|nr:sugar phosphate isomerase/epimerase [Cyclobacteriaceae bacterium]
MNNTTNSQLTNRRTFLWQAGLLTSAAFLGSAFESRKKFKLGLQLYTMRDAMAKDPKGSLKRFAEIGYEEFETYGFDAANGKYYGYDAKEFYKILSDLNLTTSSGHYDLTQFVNKSNDELKRYIDQCIEGAQALHQEYITWPWLDPESRTIDKFKIVAEKLNLIGEQVKQANLGLAYHNHDFEFIDHNGQIGYDIITKETDASLVKLQMDLYWIAKASKLAPHEWFLKYPGRYVMWHLKDMDKVSKDYSEMGNGSIDFSKIIPDTELAGVKHIFVEQGGNFKVDPFDSITVSANYVRKNFSEYFIERKKK